MSAADRFWAKVNKNGPTDPKLGTPCWLWRGALTKNGYGNFSADGKNVYAHRYSLALTGRLLDLQANHRCEHRSCVNPKHLYAGTQSDNMVDRVNSGRGVGESHHRAKLTAAHVVVIRESALSGAHLARVFGVTPALVSKIRHGHIWKRAGTPHTAEELERARGLLEMEAAR